MLTPSRTWLRGGLATAGLAVVAYCLVVMVIVATAPDLRLRWLLVDSKGHTEHESGEAPGIQIRRTEGVQAVGELPREGDELLKIDGVQVTASVDAAWRILHQLPFSSATFPWMRSRQAQASPRVHVEFRRPSNGQIYHSELIAQSVPDFEIAVTLIWLVCQLGILGLGAFAFWKRPFDRPARLFFAMCIVTLGGFVGGFHWWLLSGSMFLTLPFVVCAVLVPSVTLHFFLVYPQPKELISRWHSASLWGLYGPPLFAAVGFVVLELLVWGQLSRASTGASMSATLSCLQWLRLGVYGYLAVAAMYFLATLACLLHSVWTTPLLIERQQVTPILWAGIIASLFIGYTLVLACWDRVAFALGGARIPMFLSSLVFMVAYAVSIVRYKLMLTEESRGRGLLLECARFGTTLILGAITVPLALQVGRRTSGLPWMPVLAVGIALMVVVVVAVGARDMLQRWMERHLFRERFRLEKALQRIHRSVGQLADPQFLSERTLVACCEVLHAEWVALYLRESDMGTGFRLAGIQGTTTGLPLTWKPEDRFLRGLELESGIVSTYGDRRTETPVLLRGLAQFRGDLVHLLEIDGEPAGLVVLGPKASGGLYSSEDGTFLTALTQLTGVALHCVRVHQDLTQLNEQLRMKVERIAQQKQQIMLLQAELVATRPIATVPDDRAFRRDAIRGRSPCIEKVLETARKAAASESTVLIRGESGTGKELMARAIHENSPRRRGPLVTVHCAALAPGLLESELFGHVKGAFTGATTDRRGRFELAAEGTLFLDEVGEISLETQVKLLRVLQQREIEPVGASEPTSVNVRLVAATHRNLEEMIADGRFREDLYYRLNVITIALPALRERRDDLHELAAEFLRRAAEKCDKRVVDFEESALDALLKYEWPGNIRELENVIERAVVLSDGDLITLDDLPADLLADAIGKNSTPPRRRPPRSAGRSSNLAIATPADPAIHSWKPLEADDERQLLVEALEKTAGNKARAARLLGLPRSTFFSKLKKYSILD